MLKRYGEELKMVINFMDTDVNVEVERVKTLLN